MQKKTILPALKKTNRERTLAAVQSLSAYNLSHIYAERAPLLNHKDKPYDKENFALHKILPGKNRTLSGNELKSYLSRRLSNRHWFEQISKTASITSLLRENALLAAGNFALLNQMTENQQRLIAAQTATNTLLLMSTRLTQKLIDEMHQQTIYNKKIKL